MNAPKLSVEISAIKRTISDAAVVSLDDDPELSPLRSGRDSRSLIFDDERLVIRARSGSGKRAHTLSDLDDLLLTAKQRLRDLPAQIEERKRELERIKSLTPNALTKYECDQLNQPLDPEIDFDASAQEKTLEAFREAYQKRVQELEKRYADLQANLPSAERKLELLRKDLIDNRSFFTVSASLINSGRSNTAIKVPGAASCVYR